MSALDGAKISTKALRDLADRLRSRASELRGLAAALGEMGLDAYARRADNIVAGLHGDALRAETIRVVLGRGSRRHAADRDRYPRGPQCRRRARRAASGVMGGYQGTMHRPSAGHAAP